MYEPDKKELYFAPSLRYVRMEFEAHASSKPEQALVFLEAW